MKIKIWVKADDYNGTQVLNEQDYERLKSEEIADMIRDRGEFVEWLNDCYSSIEVFEGTKEDIRTHWEQVCAEAWEYNDGDDWEPFEVEV